MRSNAWESDPVAHHCFASALIREFTEAQPGSGLSRSMHEEKGVRNNFLCRRRAEETVVSDLLLLEEIVQGAMRVVGTP
jgi:hypothetical protein